jgi:hypothetical protein
MTQTEALRLALGFFETMQRYKGVRSKIFIRFEPTATGDYINLQEFDERAKPAITAIKAALETKYEAWEKFCDSNCVWTDHHLDCKLAQPEHCSDCGQKLGDANHIHTCSPQLKQEPVAYLSQGGNFSFEPWQGSTPLYTTPPQRIWVGLTDEEIVLIVAECAASHQHTDIHFARAIEAKLRSKND